MTSNQRLDRARKFIAKGEDFYRKAAEEIKAAMDTDPTLSYRQIGNAIGKGESYVRRLVTALTTASHATAEPFEVDWQSGSNRRDEVIRTAARERPESIAQAISESSPEDQRKVADELLKSPSTEPSVRKIAERSTGPAPQAEPPKAERKLGDGVFRLWEASELLLDETPDGEERVRITALAEKAQRLSAGIIQLLDSGELDDSFRRLLDEVGAES